MPTDPPVRPLSAEDHALRLQVLVAAAVALDLGKDEVAALKAAIAALRADPEAREREAFAAGMRAQPWHVAETADGLVRSDWRFTGRPTVHDVENAYVAYRVARAQEQIR